MTRDDIGVVGDDVDVDSDDVGVVRDDFDVDRDDSDIDGDDSDVVPIDSDVVRDDSDVDPDDNDVVRDDSEVDGDDFDDVPIDVDVVTNDTDRIYRHNPTSDDLTDDPAVRILVDSMRKMRDMAVSATGQDATQSRRETSASPFLAALDELRHALAAAANRVLSCRRATHAEYSTLRGRMRAFRRIDRAYDRLCSATDQLQRAIAALSAMIAAAPAEPELAARAPGEILLATRDIVLMTARVNEMSLTLDAVVTLVEENEKSIARPRPVPDWLYSRYPFGPLERIRLFLLLFSGRRRARCLPIEDAPRRVSRGRAPPSLSACSI